MESFFREIALHNEAWDVEHNVPCTRHFTHEELAPAIQGIRDAAEWLESHAELADSFRAIRQVNAEREGK